MASVEDNILCHICVETRQNSSSLHTRGGYSQDLLENILSPLEKSLIVCCSCEGVMRDPQFTEEGYKCSSCLDGGEGTAIIPTKGLEWEIKGIREKFEKKEDVFSDPFYVSNYKFQGSALTKISKDDSLRIKIEIEYSDKPDEFTKRVTS